MMMCYQQQAELALLQHKARLQEAAQARRIAHLRPRRTPNLSTWFARLWAQRHAGNNQPQPTRTDRIAAMRHQPS